MLWIDRDARAGVEIDEPRELHERAASGIKNQPLDRSWLSLDAIRVAAGNEYLRCS